MTESVSFDQSAMVGGGEVMEVMMTGGDGSAMTEDTLAQVVKMLQMGGQLTGGSNHTIIIRQPNGGEIQMIQATSNGGEVVVSKAPASALQELQAEAQNVMETQELLETDQGTVMMTEDGRVVQVQDIAQSRANGQLVQVDNSGQLVRVQDSGVVQEENWEDTGELLKNLVNMGSEGGQNFGTLAVQPAPPPKPMVFPRKQPLSNNNNNVISIKITTGFDRKRKDEKPAPDNVIKISTVTGKQKYQPPKFHKCTSCSINFVSKVAYMNHLENCPRKRKAPSVLPTKSQGIYTCVFCEARFTSRLVLMHHVRTCDKAKSQQALPTFDKKNIESKLKMISTSRPKRVPEKLDKKDLIEKNKKDLGSSKAEDKESKSSKKENYFDPEDEDYVEGNEDLLDSDEEDDDEKKIQYDDDEDINDEVIEDEEDYEQKLSKKSQKHLGPVMVKGKFKCRDCERTFSKEYQYNRHIRACTNAPLNSSRIDSELGSGSASSETVEQSTKKKARKRESDSEEGTPRKKVAVEGKDILSTLKAKTKLLKRKALEKQMNQTFDGRKPSEGVGSEVPYGMLKGKRSEKVSARPGAKGYDLQLKQGPKGKRVMGKLPEVSGSGKELNKFGVQSIKKKSFQFEVPICGLCGDKCKTVSDLRNHTQVCHSEDLLSVSDRLEGKSNIANYSCSLCHYRFVSSQSILLHMVAVHTEELKEAQDELVSLDLSLFCPWCSSVCLSQQLLAEHLASQHRNVLLDRDASRVIASLDVNSLVKERSTVPHIKAGNLPAHGSEQCPDCGLFVMKNHFDHHRCSHTDNSVSSARVFTCSQSQCASRKFYKLIHFLSHMNQVHEASTHSESHTFDTLSQFSDWLKKEECVTRKKFTKAMQRMKNGSFHTTWICLQESMPSESCDNLDQKLYTRILVETQFNPVSLRYDGQTSIKVYHDYKNHVKEVISRNPVDASDTEPKVEKDEPVVDAQSCGKSDSTAEDEEVSKTLAENVEAELERLHKEDEDEAQNTADKDSTEVVSDVQKEVPSTVDVRSEEHAMNGLSEKEEKTKKDTSGDGFTTADLLLEKMFGVQDEDSTSKPILMEGDIAKPILMEGDVAKPILMEGDAAKPNLMKGDIAKPILMEGDVAKPILMEGDVAKPILMEGDVAKPSLMEGDIAKPILMEGDVAKPILMEGDVAKPILMEGDVAKPILMEGDVAKPILMEGDVAKPILMEADVAKPILTEGDVAKPILTEGDVAKPILMEGDVAKPILMEGDVAKPILMEGDVAKPILMEGDVAKPILMEGDIAKPILMEGDVAEPILMEGDVAKPMLMEGDDAKSILMEGDDAKPILMEGDDEPKASEENGNEELEESSEVESKEADVSNEEPMEVDHVADTDNKDEAVAGSPIRDVDMLEGFEETESQSSTLETSSISAPAESPIPKDDTLVDKPASDVRQKSGDDETDADGEENTYVLPADAEEWKKIFDLVKSQMEEGSLEESKVKEAKDLLQYENNVSNLSIEKQIEVFSRLCALANVQMN